MFFLDAALARTAQEEAARLAQTGQNRAILSFGGSTFLLTSHREEVIALAEFKAHEKQYFLGISKGNTESFG